MTFSLPVTAIWLAIYTQWDSSLRYLLTSTYAESTSLPVTSKQLPLVLRVCVFLMVLWLSLHWVFVFLSCLCAMELMASRSKRNYLPVKKVEVIKASEKNRGMCIRELAQQFECGKTQIANILKSKESILSTYESNVSSTRVLTARSCGRQCDYGDVNKSLYEWYILACSKNIFPMGPQLIVKAKQIATCLGKHNFKGSNGWLDKWKKRYNIP